MIEISAIICKICKDTIYSRSKQDKMYCSCGQCFVDGESHILQDTEKETWIRTKGDYIPTTIKLLDFDYVYEARKALHDDFENKLDNYGRIEG